MGATTWTYFTPYDANTEAALERLREQVFREGRYERFVLSSEDLAYFQDDTEATAPAVPLEKQMLQQPGETMAQWAIRVQKLLHQTVAKAAAEEEPISSEKPTTIDELLEEQGESGTHSILDIYGISDEPEFGTVSQMPAEELEQIFGTHQPTRKMIEDKAGDYALVEHPLVSERWQGVYFAVYHNGNPAELYFIGTSGD